jgi:hypothetical protein
MNCRTSLVSLCASVLIAAAAAAQPVGTAWTYQGQLKNGAVVADGPHDFIFRLFSAASGGAQVGSSVTINDWMVTDGQFTVSLDFGATPFVGDARWLDIQVRPGASGGAYTLLTPRQPLSATPYALYALNSPSSGGPWATVGSNIHNTNAGDVGIGTSSPLRLLHTVGDAVMFERATNDAAVILRNTLNGTLNTSFGLHNTGASAGYSYLSDQTQTPLLFLNNGNVGIGSASPLTKLHITGGAENTTLADGTVFIQSGTGFGQIMTMDGNEINGWSHLHLNPDADTNIFMAAGGGNVGIDSAAPAARLHIEGGTDTELGSGGFLILGGVAGANMSIDNNEIEARNNGAASTLSLNNDGGDVVIAPQGTTRVRVLEITGADLAERFPVSGATQPGMVMEIDPANSGSLRVAQGAYNRRVAGVISGANDFAAGTILGNLPGNEQAPPVALSGRVWVFCDAAENAIELGDLLTTSDTPGHAMKVTDYPRAQGAAIGKAMTSLAKGERGLVLVLVNLQ